MELEFHSSFDSDMLRISSHSSPSAIELQLNFIFLKFGVYKSIKLLKSPKEHKEIHAGLISEQK